MPVAVMLDYLAAGQALEEFLEQHPSHRREKALRAMEDVKGPLATA